MKKKTILAACIKKKVLFASEDELNRHLRHLAERRIEFLWETGRPTRTGRGRRRYGNPLRKRLRIFTGQDLRYLAELEADGVRSRPITTIKQQEQRLFTAALVCFRSMKPCEGITWFSSGLSFWS